MAWTAVHSNYLDELLGLEFCFYYLSVNTPPGDFAWDCEAIIVQLWKMMIL